MGENKSPLPINQSTPAYCVRLDYVGQGIPLENFSSGLFGS